jgi:D-glycero-alpha-D-manno-heptose-7-phosphate kinase
MIEIEKLSKPIGIQDQWASAHGGCSDYRIAKNGEVTVNSLNVSDSQMNVLNHCLLLVDTGISRNAETITEKYSKPSGSQEKSLLQILQMANDLGEILERCNPISIPSLLAQYLNDSWELKRKLSTQVSSKQIENLYQYLIGIGCLGGKISGAGGGGYLLMVVEPAKMEQIQSHLRENNILFDCPMVSPSGAEVLISC